MDASSRSRDEQRVDLAGRLLQALGHAHIHHPRHILAGLERRAHHQIHQIPVLLGQGRRLFDELPSLIELEIVHIRYRVRR